MRDFRDRELVASWNSFREEGNPLADLELLDLQPEDRLLDLGCGSGWYALAAAKMVRSVIGVERSSAALDIARARSEQASIRNVAWIEADLAQSRVRIQEVNPTKVICWTVWRGLSPDARGAVLEGLAHTSAMVLLADLIIPQSGEADCDVSGFVAAMEARSAYWGEMLRTTFANRDVVRFTELEAHFASFGFACTRKRSNEFNTFWQILFEPASQDSSSGS